MVNDYVAHLPQARLSFMLRVLTNGRVLVSFAVQNKKDKFVKREARKILSDRMEQLVTLGGMTYLGPSVGISSLDNYYGSTPKRDLFFPLLDTLRDWRWKGATVADLHFEVTILLQRAIDLANRQRILEENQLI